MTDTKPSDDLPYPCCDKMCGPAWIDGKYCRPVCDVHGYRDEPTKPSDVDGLASLRREMELRFTGAFAENAINTLDRAATTLAAQQTRIAGLCERLIQADLKIRSFPGTDQSDVEFIRAALKEPS